MLSNFCVVFVITRNLRVGLRETRPGASFTAVGLGVELEWLVELAPQPAINNDAPTHTSNTRKERAECINNKLAPPATDNRRSSLGHPMRSGRVWLTA